MVRYGRSGSFKVIEIGTTRDPYATSYEPSIVNAYLLFFFFYRFPDITTYLSKISVFSPFYPNQYRLSRCKGFLWDLEYESLSWSPLQN